MKLSLAQHSGLSEMARHFGKIEEIADRMGIEVDLLVDQYELNNRTSDLNLKPKLHALATKRQDIFRQSNRNGNSDHSSIKNLTVIVNEDRF